MLTAVAALIAPLGCQDVIDLGKEPRVEPAYARCGLPPARNVACRDCMTASCCEAQLACHDDPECRDGATSCLASCSSQRCALMCIPQFAENQRFNELVTCGTVECQEHCAIHPVCEALGFDCCEQLETGTVQDSCFDIVRMNEEAACLSARATLSETCSSE